MTACAWRAWAIPTVSAMPSCRLSGTAAKDLNFDMVALADLWSKRREDGKADLSKAFGHDMRGPYTSGEDLYERGKDVDAVIISTADFQHAFHARHAVEAGRGALLRAHGRRHERRQRPVGCRHGKNAMRASSQAQLCKSAPSADPATITISPTNTSVRANSAKLPMWTCAGT